MSGLEEWLNGNGSDEENYETITDERYYYSDSSDIIDDGPLITDQENEQLAEPEVADEEFEASEIEQPSADACAQESSENEQVLPQQFAQVAEPEVADEDLEVTDNGGAQESSEKLPVEIQQGGGQVKKYEWLTRKRIGRLNKEIYTALGLRLKLSKIGFKKNKKFHKEDTHYLVTCEDLQDNQAIKAQSLENENTKEGLSQILIQILKDLKRYYNQDSAFLVTINHADLTSVINLGSYKIQCHSLAEIFLNTYYIRTILSQGDRHRLRCSC